MTDKTDPAKELDVREPQNDKPCFVVGIGASAGGQGPLEHLFTAIPPDCGLSFVVIMHLPPEGPSFLATMLARYTTMPVVTVEDGMRPAPDTVQVIPAGRDLVLSGGLLRLEEPAGGRGAHHPINRLFRSLAAEMKERAVAVVLSGAGTDGAEGVKEVREEGGIVVVQEPGSAINPGMPMSAIATGAADFILPADEIPGKIAEIARGTCALSPRKCRTTTLEEELQTIFAIVKARTGNDFSSYKANTVMRRIERRMAVNEAGGIGRYIALLGENVHEAQALAQDILIGVTSFFRDPEAFAAIRREVIPPLFAERNPDDPVRIWHPCCATGEEAYSMAFLIREYLNERKLDTKVQIFATDIDEAAIAQARAGLYPDDIAADVGEERLRAFFTRTDNRWQVMKPLREMIVFAHHSLLKNPPFSRLDLLVCRNFLIYLNPDMQKRLMSLFHQVLKPGGFLFLGSAETVGRHSDLFTTVDKKWKIFQRLESGRRGDTLFPFAAPVRGFPGMARLPRPAGAFEPSPGALAEKLLLERYSPPCVVVNEKYEVVHVSTRTNRFLEVPIGEPTRDILRLARAELRPPLRAAIYKAFAEQKEVVFRGVKVAIDGKETAVNVLVAPAKTEPPAEKLAMVVFEPAPSPPALPAPGEGGEEPAGDETSRETLIRQLEEQLHITHEQLHAVTEQLESSNAGFLSANEELISMNEEFQSANEELQSTNEELETSKEELQALNEELVTVNSELQGKVEELNQANNDMENLLVSSGIATLFLDRRLTIKGFTPAMAAIFNLIPADIGRPFRHLAGTIDWSGLARDAEEVLGKLLPIEREVAAVGDGRCFIMRVLPYRTTEGAVEGIVVTLIDITEHKRLEEQTRHLASFPQLNPNPVLEVDLSGNIIFANPATEKVLESLGMEGGEPGVFLPADLDDIIKGWDRQEEATLYREITIKERSFGESIFLTPQFDVARIYAFDITELKQAQEALAESEERVRRKLDSILSPEGEMGNLDLGDIIDARAMQSLMDNFYKLSRIPMGMIDLKGKVLVGVGWQDVCTKFHRIHPETCKNCIESDTLLSAGVPQGEFKLYKCKNNMWDVATPIMVGDRQFGNFFMGQFLFEDEPLDYEFFRSQARRYGFAEEEYITCLERVPRLSRETLATGMAYFMELAEMISRTSYSNLKLARSLADRDTLMDSLRQSEERLNRAQEIAQLGSWELDIVNDRLTWSDEVYRIFGLRPQEFGATYEAFLEAIHPDDRAAVNNAYSGSLREGRDTYEIEHRIVRKSSGEVRLVHEKCEHFRDASGRVIRSVGMVHDITKRKQVEEELRRAKEAAEAANRAKRQFLANMSHELRTPMTGVLGTLDLALGGPLETQQREFLCTAHKSARSLLRIINDILDLTKVEAGILSIEEKPFTLRDCVTGAVDILIPEARRKGIELIRPAADDLRQTVVGDQLRLRQVLTNLIGNAVKFTERGKVEVQVAVGEKTAAGRREFIFTVTDTGIGIPADKKHLLFRSFSQVDNSDTRGYGGAGLGLAISMEIAQRLGGSISFESEEGVGSTFTFTVPLGEDGTESETDGTEEPAAGAAPLPLTGVRRRILIAEDDPITRKVIGMMLNRSNYETDFAGDGMQAVGMWENGEYDLILMDMQMPRMDGFEATRAIREKEKERGGHIPIIALTAHALKEDEEKCLAAGMDSYLAKPINFAKCLAMIGEMIKK